MNKQMIISVSVALTVAVILFTSLIDTIMIFLLAGIVPGTHIVAPYWFMMAVYCILISVIATPYLERIIKFLYDKRQATKSHPRPTHRRSILTSISLR